jgi:type IV secretion system protein VirB6
MSVTPTNVVVFQPLITMFDNTVNQTIVTGSANLISLISPLVAAGLGVYMLLIMTSYWRVRPTSRCLISSCALPRGDSSSPPA